ncbi:MAG: DUF4440 domain-containing protein [Planctomycetaceae bacterium]
MSAALETHILELTEELLTCISQSDWDTYQRLCDPTLSAFEPEACGQLVQGLEFHRFYFELGGHMGAHNSTLVAPCVRLLGEQAAMITYVRLVQSVDKSGCTHTQHFEETRVWQLQQDAWRHVHFHRSIGI